MTSFIPNIWNTLWVVCSKPPITTHLPRINKIKPFPLQIPAKSCKIRNSTPEDEKRLSKRSTHNREAYQLLLKSQYHMNKWTPEAVQHGMEYARQAIEADPGYAEVILKEAKAEYAKLQ
jgi:hypothetical protein